MHLKRCHHKIVFIPNICHKKKNHLNFHLNGPTGTWFSYYNPVVVYKGNKSSQKMSSTNFLSQKFSHHKKTPLICLLDYIVKLPAYLPLLQEDLLHGACLVPYVEGPVTSLVGGVSDHHEASPEPFFKNNNLRMMDHNISIKRIGSIVVILTHLEIFFGGHL